MKKSFLSLIILSLGLTLFAQNPIPQDAPIKNDIIKINHNKKDAKLAMLMSAVVPGSGQIYTNKKSITGYIFSALEVSFWVMKFNYESKGDDKTKDYEKYADAHYNRDHWELVKNQIISISGDYDPDGTHDIYTDKYFGLDENKTQHYYEDIGKYPKYYYGWDDWFDKFVDADQVDSYGQLNNDAIAWHWSLHPEDTYNCDVIDGASEVGSTYITTGFPSQYRETYVAMRSDANDYYRTSNNINFLIAVNHIVASLDAVRVARKHNRDYISSNSVKFNVETRVVDNKYTPMFTLSKRF